jgi:hypothetical protein
MSDTLTPVRPPLLSKPTDDEKAKRPLQWVVFVGYKGYFCQKLLVNTLVEIFGVNNFGALTLSNFLQTVDASVGVTVLLSRDLAETKADKANAYVLLEQGPCTCKSSLYFEAYPISDNE